MTDQSITLSELQWDAVTAQLNQRISLLRITAEDKRLRASERVMTLTMADELEAIYAAIIRQRIEPQASRKA